MLVKNGVVAKALALPITGNHDQKLSGYLQIASPLCKYKSHVPQVLRIQFPNRLRWVLKGLSFCISLCNHGVSTEDSF